MAELDKPEGMTKKEYAEFMMLKRDLAEIKDGHEKVCGRLGCIEDKLNAVDLENMSDAEARKAIEELKEVFDYDDAVQSKREEKEIHGEEI